MGLRKYFTASLVSGLAMWGLAGLWHELVAATFYTEHQGGNHQGVVVILFAYWVLGLLMSYLYPRLKQTGSTLQSGILFGMVIGVLWVFPHELALAGAHGKSLVYVFGNGAWHIVEQALGGVIIAYVYRRKPNSE